MLLRSSTTVSVKGAIAPGCEENCRDGMKGNGGDEEDEEDARSGENSARLVAQWQWTVASMGEVEFKVARRSVVGRSKLLYGKMLPSARSSVPSHS